MKKITTKGYFLSTEYYINTNGILIHYRIKAFAPREITGFGSITHPSNIHPNYLIYAILK